MTAATIAMMPAALLIAVIGYLVAVLSLMWMWDNDEDRNYHAGYVGIAAGLIIIGLAFLIVAWSAGLV